MVQREQIFVSLLSKVGCYFTLPSHRSVLSVYTLYLFFAFVLVDQIRDSLDSHFLIPG